MLTMHHVLGHQQPGCAQRHSHVVSAGAGSGLDECRTSSALCICNSRSMTCVTETAASTCLSNLATSSVYVVASCQPERVTCVAAVHARRNKAVASMNGCDVSGSMLPSGNESSCGTACGIYRESLTTAASNPREQQIVLNLQDGQVQGYCHW